MALILKIAAVLLAALAVLLGLLLLLTFPRTGVRILCQNRISGVWLRYGRVSLRIYPLPGHMSRKAGKPSKSAKQPRRASPKRSLNFRRLDLGDTITLLLDLLDEIQDGLRLDTIRIDAVLATGDAARTGILLGQLAALSGMVTPFLEQRFDIRDYHIAVDGDFQGDTPRWEAEFAFSARPIRIGWALFKRRRSLLRLYDALQNTEANEL